MIKTSALLAYILGKPVKTQQNKKLMLIQKIQDTLVNEAPVGGHGEMDMFFQPFILLLNSGHSMLDPVKCKERLSPVKIDVTFLGQKREEKINSILYSGGIYVFLPFYLITVRAVKIAVLCHHKSKPRELHTLIFGIEQSIKN